MIFFQERQQKDNDTVEEFFRELKSLVVHCQYKDTEDQLRDRFAIGLRDRFEDVRSRWRCQQQTKSSFVLYDLKEEKHYENKEPGRQQR